MHYVISLPVPELLLRVLDEERLQGVANLIAHVRIGEVETGEHGCLQLRFLYLLPTDQLPDQHVDKDHIRRVDEGDILER